MPDYYKMNDSQSEYKGVRIIDSKKRMIALSAIEVFRDKGIEKATVSDIVKGAGVAQGTFYLYYPSKLSVMSEIASIMIEKTISTIKDQINATNSIKNICRQLIDIIFHFSKEYQDINALIYVGLGSNKQLDEWEKIYEPYYQLVEKFIKKAQKNGELTDTISAQRTAVLLIGTIEAAADQSFLYANEQDDTIIQLKKEETLQFVMYGLSNI